MAKKNPKLQSQWEHCEKDAFRIPYCVMIGAGEIAEGVVKVKDMAVKEGEEKQGVRVPRAEMVAHLRTKLNMQ